MKTYKQFLAEVIKDHGYDLTWMEKFGHCASVHKFTEMAAKRYADQSVEYALNDASNYIEEGKKFLITGAQRIYP